MRELQLDQEKNCLVGECLPDSAESPDLKMLLYNNLPGYLSVRIQYINNRSVCLYTLDGKTALPELLNQRSVDVEFVRKIYFDMLDIMSTGREYLLNPVHLVLEPEYIYWDIREERLSVCYFPEYGSGVAEKMEQFSQYLLRHVDHKDRGGAVLMYGIFDLIAGNRFDEQKIRKYLKDTMEKDGIGFPGEEGQSEEDGMEQLEHGKCGETEENVRSGKGERKREGYEYSKKKKWDHEKEGGGNATIGLRNISGERGIPQWVMISEKGMTVGRGEENEMVLPLIQVSRQHARIEYEGEQLFLTDRNSTNGVWLNGRRLFASRPVPCRCGDEISFAGIAYRIERQAIQGISS